MNNDRNWVGSTIAQGRYTVVERIGIGSMGLIYRAHDQNLDLEVVIKCPVPADADQLGAGFLERFDREIRALVRFSHPHIVKIYDIGTHDGYPFVVMQHLAGGSLKDRMMTAARRAPGPLPFATLREWLPQVAKALDFVHSQNYLHRDVKPDNILFDRHGHPFLSDFGIIKKLENEGRDAQTNAMTAPGFLMGTPEYVAPEVIMGGPVGPRIDQYALAMTVHEVLIGSKIMAGATPSATLVNQTKLDPPALIDLVAGVPKRASDAVRRGMSKTPAQRFANCQGLATEILAEVPTGASATPAPPLPIGKASLGETGRVNCPVCQNMLPLGREHAGKRIQCLRCRTILNVQFSMPNSILVNVVTLPSVS